MGLILHTGAHTVERSALARVVTPKATETWFPIPHHNLLTQVEAKLATSGLTVVEQAHGLTRDGLRYFGLLQVKNGSQQTDFGLVVGVRNSHDMSFPAGLVIGSHCVVCDNLAFSGEIRIMRKHTKFINRDLPQLVEIAVGQLTEHRLKQETRFLTYKETELSNAEAHDLVIQSLDAQVVPVTKVPALLDEWRQPRHPEFAKELTAWRLFNAFSEILKGHLELLPRRTQALHGIMDAHCGLLLPAPEVELANAV
jgi:Domain of unknown function (DUF932)